MHGIKLELDRYYMEQQKNMPPVPAPVQVLHTNCHDYSVQNVPAPDLMVFNENQAGNSDKNGPRQPDFLSGV